MSQNKNQHPSDAILDSKEIKKLSSEKPLGALPYWELIFAAAFAVVFAVFFYFGLFSRPENATLDFRFEQRGKLPETHDIVLISITDECIAQLGTWPWPRANHGKLLSILKSERAKLVAFDLMFTEQSIHGQPDDQEFARGISEFGRVLLPNVSADAKVLDKDTFEIVTKTVLSRPIDLLREAGAIEGFIDISPELNPDGVVRRVNLYRKNEDTTYHILGLAAAAEYLASSPEIHENSVSLAGRTLPLFERYEPKIGKPVRSYLINYSGGHSQFTDISYSDVMNGNFKPGFFNNRLVLIGARAKGISEDVKLCPFGAINGVEIHANILHNILNQRFLRQTSAATTILLIAVFAFGLAYLMVMSHSFFANTVCIGSALAYGIFGVVAFNFDLVIDIAPICIMIPLQWALTRLIQQFVSLQQKNYELACKVRELAIINEISQAVSFMGDLDKTLGAILSRCVQVLDAQKGSLFMLDDNYDELVEKAAIFGVDGEATISSDLKEQFKSGKGIAGQVFNSGKPRLVQNVRKEKSFEKTDIASSDIKSLICVPLTIKENAIGVMNIVNRRDGKFGEHDLQTALTMANQAAIVIEKARLYNLATIDGLTGLVVHRHFQAKMEEEFRRARRYGKPLSYLMTDIDHFKKFNDTWGHQIGDMVLREVARIVRDSVRDTDIAARYGGEEFAVILPETETDGAVLFAERLRQQIETAAFPGPKGDLKVTISVGVSSLLHNQPESPLDMIKMADEALYVCKENGRNRVELSRTVKEAPEVSS